MTHNFFRIVIISTLFAISFSPVQAKIKCWKNSDGVRECGNTIPPEYSQQDTMLKNSQGITLKQKSRAMSKEELAEKAQLAKAERKKQRLLKKQKDADKLLLDTFTSSDDIILAREGKISSIESEISLRQRHIEKTKLNLEKMISAAADMERRGKQPSEKILNNIQRVRHHLDDNARYIKLKQQEKEAVKAQYNRDALRYEELQGKTNIKNKKNEELIGKN